jgi:hypothetical protein
MDDKSAARRTWRPWTLWLACTVAFAVCGLLIVAEGLAGVMGSWDTPEPGIGWIKVGVIGQCVMAVASVAVLVAGLRQARWRRAAVIAAWAIIPVGFGWFVLTGRLVGG